MTDPNSSPKQGTLHLVEKKETPPRHTANSSIIDRDGTEIQTSAVPILIITPQPQSNRKTRSSSAYHQ
eukprot:m.77886 g.77886  ORF g.77886 m.77886 type:complete len:68 (-) comp8556_c2_seq1:798-1001(-)